MKTGYIYCATCLPTGKSYFGQTVKKVSERWGNHVRSAFRGSDHKFHRAIRKYGEENFLVEEVLTVSAPTKESLKRKLDYIEIRLIKRFDTKISGYNSTDGGESKLGYIVSEGTKRKISESNCGRRSPFKGKVHSEGSRIKMKTSHLGKKLSEETKRKISESHKGLKHSENSKLKIRKAHQGKNRPRLSEKWKQNISISLKIRNYGHTRTF